MGPLFSVDEYPLASTEEGGLYNGRYASTALVPRDEQQIQSQQILALYSIINSSFAVNLA